MRTKILAIVFAAALALGMAVPAFAGHDGGQGKSQDASCAGNSAAPNAQAVAEANGNAAFNRC